MQKDNENNNIALRNKPAILFEKKVFKYIIETKSKNTKYRTLLYNNLDNALGFGKKNHDTYRTWFSDPSRIPKSNQEFYNLLGDALLATLLQQNSSINSITQNLIEEHEKEMRK